MGVDEADRHRVGMKRLRAGLAELLPEELERVAGIVAHRDQRGRRQNEGDAGNVWRVFRFADEAAVQVAHSVLGVIGFGRLGEIGIGARRHFATEKELDLLVLAGGRLDHVEPHRAGWNGLGGFKNLARRRRDPCRLARGFRDIVHNDHARPRESFPNRALGRNYTISCHFADARRRSP
jgi:hypothetical protein